MITLKSAHYTKADFEYLMRIAIANYTYCFEECEKCPHSLACRDLQDLAFYCREKIDDID